MIYFLQEVGKQTGGTKKRREMVCQPAEKRSSKCLELFTAEMANQY